MWRDPTRFLGFFLSVNSARSSVAYYNTNNDLLFKAPYHIVEHTVFSLIIVVSIDCPRWSRSRIWGTKNHWMNSIEKINDRMTNLYKCLLCGNGKCKWSEIIGSTESKWYQISSQINKFVCKMWCGNTIFGSCPSCANKIWFISGVT